MSKRDRLNKKARRKKALREAGISRAHQATKRKIGQARRAGDMWALQLLRPQPAIDPKARA